MISYYYTRAPATYDYPRVTTSWGFATDRYGNEWRRIAICDDPERSPGHASTQIDRYESGFYKTFARGSCDASMLVLDAVNLDRGSAGFPTVEEVYAELQRRDEEG